MTIASIVTAVIALLLFLVNIVLRLRDRNRPWYFMPRSRAARFIMVLTAVAVVALWFAFRHGLMIGSTYLTIVFCWFALMQVSILLGNREKD
jgi:uncharacterized membrane protein YhaH (DUF805 family)